ncbi:GNAT family N-acetyltransferase [Oceanobacillus sp. FSL K6-2867]|uniref:GNAT family N-acetyltransferase n=1 Tax=Oceanobacillus sp. FSL K6-2867 TaxID=2954748 RepID=UPI0030DCEFB3
MQKLFHEDTFGEYKVRKATVEDTEAVIQLLQGAARWLEVKGISQWEYLRNGGETTEIKQGILVGTTYVVENRGSLAATMNLSDVQNEWDMELWGEAKGYAFYIHRLAVAQAYRRQQIGRKLLDWIALNIRLENGRIRLDCVADNPALNQLYQRAGFELKGTAANGEDKFSLYEKLITSKP